jgi:hypothetical protein
MDKEIKKEVASEEELEDLENMMKEFKWKKQCLGVWLIL